MIFYYWLFNYGFKLQDCVCNSCHDLTTLSVKVSDIAIITIKNIVLFITLVNLKQLIYYKILFLKIVGIYKKYCLKFQSI